MAAERAGTSPAVRARRPCSRTLAPHETPRQSGGDRSPDLPAPPQWLATLVKGASSQAASNAFPAATNQ